MITIQTPIRLPAATMLAVSIFICVTAAGVTAGLLGGVTLMQHDDPRPALLGELPPP